MPRKGPSRLASRPPWKPPPPPAAERTVRVRPKVEFSAAELAALEAKLRAWTAPEECARRLMALAEGPPPQI